MSRRIYHNIGGEKVKMPDHRDKDHMPGVPDESILVWDGALTEDECEEIIQLFEDSEHYEGNLVSNGRIVVGESCFVGPTVLIANSRVTNRCGRSLTQEGK